MGAILLLTCTIILCIVLYIVYFKQKQNLPYPYQTTYYPRGPTFYPTESYRKPQIPPSDSKYYYNNNYSNFKYNYNYLNNTNSKSPNGNFDYSIKAKILQSPGYYLKNYRNDGSSNIDYYGKDNFNYMNTPESIHQMKYNNIDYNQENRDKIRMLETNPNNFKIINAGDFLSQYNKNSLSQTNTTNNKNVVLNTPASTSAFKSIFKPEQSSGFNNTLNKDVPIENKNYPSDEAKSIIKKLEFTEAMTSHKKNV